MTVTGYTVEGLGDNPRRYVCADCADSLNLKANGHRIKKVETSQFRHGSGGGECVLCGFDTLDTLSGWALNENKDTPRSHVTHGNPPKELEAYADVLEASLDAFVLIRLGPGVEPEETEIAPGVKSVSHPDDAPETLIVEFQRNNEDGSRETDCKELVELLEGTPLRTAVLPNNRGDGLSDAVHAVLE